MSNQPGFANSALLDDELLLDLCAVLEHDLPAGPSFVHSLGALAEAIVIHDNVYFDPLGGMRSRDRAGDSIREHLGQFHVVQELIRCEALKMFPSEEQVDSHLALAGAVDYCLRNFHEQFTWLDQIGLNGMRSSWSASASNSELDSYLFLQNLVKHAPFLFSPRELMSGYIADGHHPASLIIRNTGDNVPALSEARKLGMDSNSVAVLEGFNRRARAYAELSAHLGIHLYLQYNALPHLLGAARMQRFEVRSVYEKVVAQITSDDLTTIGSSSYERIPIAPIAQIAMARCKGSPRALVHELLALRQRHAKFRAYLTHFENQWNQAETREDRRRLHLEFRGSWEGLLAKEDRPLAGIMSRIIGFTWQLAKSLTPLGAATAVGDKVIASWQDHSVVRKVSGLHDFYSELARSPIPERNRQLVDNLSLRIAEQPVWEAAKAFAHDVNTAFIIGDDS
jgi:hypothetical protein